MTDLRELANAVRYRYLLIDEKREEVAKALERLAEVDVDLSIHGGTWDCVKREADALKRIAALEAELAAVRESYGRLYDELAAERAKHQRELNAAREATAYRSDQLDAESAKSATLLHELECAARSMSAERAKSARYEDAHPWGAFLRARLRCLAWLRDEHGETPEKIVVTMQMDPMQVRLLLDTHDRQLAAEALAKAGSLSEQDEELIAELEEKIAKTRDYADSSGGSSGGSGDGSGGT